MKDYAIDVSVCVFFYWFRFSKVVVPPKNGQTYLHDQVNKVIVSQKYDQEHNGFIIKV